MTADALFDHHYPPGHPSRAALLAHSHQVARKAVAIADSLQRQGIAVDRDFVREAALLHDLGVLATDAPDIGCHGSLPYICHGVEGRRLAEAAGLPRHALVCERHIGVGLTAEDIRRQELPLPARDMVPLTLEEEIVAYADLFFSKNPKTADREKSPAQVRTALARFGVDKVAIFDGWHHRFGRD